MLAPHVVEPLLADLFRGDSRGVSSFGERGPQKKEGGEVRGTREKKDDKKKSEKCFENLKGKKPFKTKKNRRLTRASASRIAYHVDTHPVWWYDRVPFQPQ